MRLFFCGGAGEVGASCILVEIAGKRILLDCGMRMKGDALPDLQTVQDAGGVDAIVLSHAHMDHSGNLPLISSAYPNAQIYMTPPTQALIRVLLYDSLKIMEMDGDIPVFDKKQVEAMLDRVMPLGLQDVWPLFNDCDIQLSFYPAGHILGAAAVYLHSKDGSLFYSGDFSVTPQRTVDGLSVPRLRPDACIIESTYGNRLHSNRDVEQNRLIEIIQNNIEKGGKILIPAFAVGRAQEVVLALRSAINSHKLPECKIYLDGMVREVSRIYRSFPNYLRPNLAKRIFKGHDAFFSDQVVAVESPRQREEIVRSEEPCVIVASSGMLSGGASAFYAEKLASDENSFIAITGYQDEESPGRKLQELFSSDAEEKCWIINGKSVPLKCGLGTYGLSAHADKSELMGVVDRLQPKQLFLVHGDPLVIAELGKEMQQKIRGRVYAPSNGSSYFIQGGGGRHRVKELSFSLQNNVFPQAEDLAKLYDELQKRQQKGPWTALELLHIWGLMPENPGESEATMTALLNASPWFEVDARRLFLFHLVTEPVLEKEKGPMEVNQMLALVGELFPSETGLYKKGARLESHTARLLFQFPAVSREKFARKFQEFKELSGWAVELNDNPDTSAFQPLLIQLLGDDAPLLKKVSWRLDQDCVTAELSGCPEKNEPILADFRNKTGLSLILKTPEGTRKSTTNQHEALALTPPGGDKVAGGQTVNRQEAMEMVEDIFEPEPIRIYKQSVKNDGAGEYLELQFLTPELGKRYQGWIDGLKYETGWRIVFSQSPRQQELIETTRHLFSTEGITILKGPGVVTTQAAMKIKSSEITSELRSKLEQKHLELTGYKLILK